MVLGGKFVVIRELGKGGMGVVYEVTHRLTGHRRALKVLKVGSEEVAKRTLREASAAGLINSPHVVDTYDAGYLPDGRVYILMEMLEGQTLGQLIRQRTMLPVGLACRILGQVSEGLRAAHEAGIVHRDIKPANIFVLSRPGEVFAKLLDFGVSKFDTALTEVTSFTEAGKLIGTPMYMAPEQMRAGNIDGKADIYSMASVVYFSLSGQRPFPAKVLAELAVLVDRGAYVPLDQLRPDLPPSLVSLVHRGLSREPEDRPTAVDFRDVLFAIAADQPPISLWPEPASEVGPHSVESAPLSIRKHHDTPAVPSSLAAGMLRASQPPDAKDLLAEAHTVTPEVAGAAAVDIIHVAPSDGRVSVAPTQIEEPPPKRSRAPLIVAGIAVVLLGAFGAYRLATPTAEVPPMLATPREEPPKPIEPITPPSTPSAVSVAPSAPASVALPELPTTSTRPPATKASTTKTPSSTTQKKPDPSPSHKPGGLDRTNPYSQ